MIKFIKAAVIVLLSLTIYPIYTTVQKLVFSSSSDFLFVGSRFLNDFIFIFSAILGALLLGYFLYGRKVALFLGSDRDFNPAVIFSVFAVVYIGVLAYLFCSYTIVSDEGITYRESIFKPAVTYEWDKVENVTVFSSWKEISRGRHGSTFRKVLNYNINMKDGRIFNLVKYPGFWDKILLVDDCIKYNDVEISRQRIDIETYRQLLDTYDSDGLQVTYILGTLLELEKAFRTKTQYIDNVWIPIVKI